jgi:NADPH2:quinone reductase
VKAIRIHSHGDASVLKYEEVPTPELKPGQALIVVEAAGLNYIDVYHRTGAYTGPMPITLGQEGAGIVTHVADDVTTVKPGDRVGWTGIFGSYAQIAAIPADRLVSIPPGITTRQAAAAMLQGMTAHYLAKSTYPLKAGDTCLVHAGAGGVGLLLTQIAKMCGAQVITTVSNEEKAALSRDAGADYVIDYTAVEFDQEARRITGGRGLQVVYDSVGKTTFDRSLNSLAPRGMMVLFGQSSGPIAPVDPATLVGKGSLFFTRPSLVHHIATRQELVARSQELFDWIQTGRLRLRMEHEFPLEQAADAHRALEGRRTTGKVLLIPAAPALT